MSRAVESPQHNIPPVPENAPPRVNEPATQGISARSAITLLGTALGGALMLAVEIVMARYLGLRNYGFYTVAIVIARIGEMLSMLGVGISILHFVPLYRSRNDHGRLAGAIRFALALPVIVGAILTGILWFTAPSLARWISHDEQAIPYLRGFACAIPFMGLAEVCGRITRGFGHAIFHVLIRDLIPRFMFLALLLAVMGFRGNPHWMINAFILSSITAGFAGLFCVIQVAGREACKSTSQIPFREMSAYSFLSFISVVLALIMGAAEYLLIGVLRSPEEAGLFRGALQYAGILQVITHAFAASTVHLYPVLVGESRHDELSRVYGSASRSVNALTSLLFVVLALNRVDLLQLLGNQFTVAADALLILLAANLIRNATGISPYILLVTNRPRAEIFNSIVGIGSSVLFNFLLVPRFGVIGAATAIFLTASILAIIRLLQMHHYYNLKTFTPQTLTPWIVSGICGSLIFVLAKLSSLEDGQGILGLGIRMPFAVIVLSAALWFFRDVFSHPPGDAKRHQVGSVE
jgi:O-antigen/teichoic acid export membrane protein